MTAELRLISHKLCPYVQRAVIALTEKGVAFERIDIDLANKPGWFLAISPLGKTPVLGVGDTAIFESAVILEYLEETQPKPLHPADALARAEHRAWIGMQLLMRRPEVEGFISIAPPANLYDFSFLAPCPSSGLIVHGEKDAVVPPKDVNTLVEKLKTQKGIVIDQQIIPGANHFFDGKLQPLMETVTGYLDMRLANVR